MPRAKELRTAMILAAGLGTRLKPFTNSHPKALAMVNGQTVLARNVLYLKAVGIEKIVVNVHHFANQIIDHITANAGWGITIIVSNETDKVLETGGGVKKAIPLFGHADDVLVMNADILTDLPLKQFIHQHQSTEAAATLAISNRPSNRQFLFDSTLRLCGWINHQTGERKQRVDNEAVQGWSFSGLQIINKSIYAQMPFEGKFSLVDAYLSACTTQKILGFDHSGNKFIDIGTVEKLALANEWF